MGFTKSIFEIIGGEAKLDAFIDDFAERLRANPEIGYLYPEDMSRIKNAYRAYAMELFGGPRIFSTRVKEGASRLRQAHADIAITKNRADEMLKCAVQTMEHFHVPKMVQTSAVRKLEDQVYTMVNVEAR